MFVGEAGFTWFGRPASYDPPTITLESPYLRPYRALPRLKVARA